MGDGTTSVVIVAAELLKRANDLVRAKIHPTSIIGGYRLAMREASAARLHRCVLQPPAPCRLLAGSTRRSCCSSIRALEGGALLPLEAQQR